jgi:NADPH-dependent 2,4-dienoyl-CoA reductase/sulfur reductase-like enzyme
VPPHECPAKGRDARHFVVIGAGAAALAAAETWRAEGFTGRITLLSKEPGLPYDRTKMSKNLDATQAEAELRPRAWFDAARVTLRAGVTAYAVHAAEKRVELESGESIPYDALLCASGGPARSAASARRSSALAASTIPQGAFHYTADDDPRCESDAALKKPLRFKMLEQPSTRTAAIKAYVHWMCSCQCGSTDRTNATVKDFESELKVDKT